MAAAPPITSDSFITFTNPADMANDTTRNTVASHAAKVGRQRRRKKHVDDEPRKIVHRFLIWRKSDRSASPKEGPSTEEKRDEEQTEERDERPDDQQDEGQDEEQERLLKSISRDVIAQRRPAYPSPLEILGQHRQDPFSNYPVSDYPVLVHEVVDHDSGKAVRHFWPGLSPSRVPNTANPVNEPYLRSLRSSRLAFYAYMVGTAENYELLSGIYVQNKSFSQLCASYRVALIQEMNQEIQEMKGPPSDELLGAIVVLAANSVMFAGRARLAPLNTLHLSKFQSPLSTAQFLNVYSARPFVSPHSEALVRLTIMKGGCSKIEIPGTAGVVALCDLVAASQNNSQLYILALDPPDLSMLHNLRDVAGGALADWTRLLATWRKLPISENRQAQVLAAVEAMLMVNAALDCYLQASGPEVALADIVNARNDSQYLVLSLPPIATAFMEEPSNVEALPEHFYEVIRLGLRIYSNLVLFPMNPAGGTSKILSSALRDAFEQAEGMASWEQLSHDCKRLLLWVSVLGGLQVDDDVVDRTDEREWFLDQAIAFSSSVGISTWYEVKQCLVSFMWSEYVLTVAAWEFWSDAESKVERGMVNVEFNIEANFESSSG